ncbi:diacylglycerol kinase [Pseudoroseomonas rhizosphaerae]|uniref:Diacylglycerol kinase n=1 Tax=Teichococcus rhizosphaerae TaxID=1335062 RepID=A0A2C7AC04_9PROT|nr:diacylglycerol kinase family protein [Pseudoroseomonas rhizosphaerae]PHK95589.1 diacylglycerol kinase [Pseudoroseomonas rhizosphaerae]
MLIIFNPTAGPTRRRNMTRILSVLLEQGIQAELATTAHAGHAEEIAREAAREGRRVVAAAGGDGTIAEVASGLAGSGTALGILPLGTVNVLACELGIPRTPERAAMVLAQGRMAALRPGMARFADGRTRLFLQMLGAGFDAAVVAELSLPLKRQIGRGAYVWQTVRQLSAYRFPPVTAWIDGKAEVAASVVVTKNRFYAGRYELAPEALPGEEGFHVVLFRRSGALATALYGAALPLNLLPRMAGVEIRRAKAVRLEGPAALAQMDGDPAGALPVEIDDAPGPLRVLLPP